MDHVFVDQDAIPTLVEVKRSSDTRIRREVVGQLLEYGANAVSYWPSGSLRASFEARCEAERVSPEEVLWASLGQDMDADEFWSATDENLRTGRIRLLFAADQVSPELQRIVEFLNEQMSPAEVLALEVRQFVGAGRQTLVPRIIGSTMFARDRKAPARSRQSPWTGAEFLKRLEQAGFASEAGVARKVLDWADQQGLGLSGGTGSQVASLYLLLDFKGGSLKPFSLYEGSGKGGVLHVHLDQLGPVFAPGEPARSELCQRFNEIPDVDLDSEAHYPSMSLSLLVGDDAMRVLVDSMSSAVRAIRRGVWR